MMQGSAGNMAQQEVFAHAHPMIMAAIPLAFALVIISIIVLVRWLMSKSAWPFHPRGAGGFLRDEIIRYASIWLPFSIAMVGVRYWIYRYHPEYMESPYLYALYLSIFVFRRLAGFLPHVREIGARIDGARRAAREAKAGISQ